jgi:hypothetical protein
MTCNSWAGPKSDGHDALEHSALVVDMRGHALSCGGGELAGGITTDEQLHMSSTNTGATSRVHRVGWKQRVLTQAACHQKRWGNIRAAADDDFGSSL